MEMMLLSFLGPAIRCEWTDVSVTQESSLTFWVFAGMLIGTLCFGSLSDAWGRYKVVLIAVVVCFVAGVLTSSATNIYMLMMWRFIVGFGVGGIPVAFALFMEVLPTPSRGKLSVMMQGWWSVGALLQAGLAAGIMPVYGWRGLVIASAAPLVIFLGLFSWWGSESPRWLMNMHRADKAVEVVERIAKTNLSHAKAAPILQELKDKLEAASGADPAASPVAAETNQLLDGASRPAAYGTTEDVNEVVPVSVPRSTGTPILQTLKELLSPDSRRQTLIIWALWFLCAFLYYGIVLFTTELQVEDAGGCDAQGTAAAGLRKEDFNAILLSAAAEVPGTLLTAWAIEHHSLGRRGLQTLTFGLSSAAFLFLYFFDGGWVRTTTLFIGRAATLSAFLVVYTLTPELVPTRLRSTAFGLANAFGRIGGAIAPLGSGLVASGNKDIATLMFAGLSIISTVMTFGLKQETAGVPLHHAEGAAAAGSPDQDYHAVATPAHASSGQEHQSKAQHGTVSTLMAASPTEEDGADAEHARLLGPDA